MATIKGNAAVAMFVLVLIAVTLVLFDTRVRYETLDPNLLQNASFGEGLAGWRVVSPSNVSVTDEGTLQLRPARNGKNPAVYKNERLPAGAQAIILRVEAMTRPASAETSTSKPIKALVEMHCRRSTGPILFVGDASFISIPLPRQSPWQSFVDTLVLPVGSHTCRVSVRLISTQSTLQIRNLRVIAVTEWRHWSIARLLLAAIWLLTSLVIAWLLLRSLPTLRRRLLLIACSAVFLTLAMLPKPVGMIVQSKVLEFYPGFVHIFDGVTLSYLVTVGLFDYGGAIRLSKLGHVVAFAVIAIVIMSIWSRTPRWRLVLHLSLVAGAAEIAQVFLVDRHARFGDWILDLLGIVIGVGVAATITFVIRTMRRPPTASRS